MSLLYLTLVLSLGLYLFFVLFFLSGLFRLKQSPLIASDNLSKATVIVVARNETKNLPGLLTDLIKQDYPKELLEIIIVDDRSSDETWNIIDAFAGNNPQVKGIKIEQRSTSMTPKKHAITAAVRAATGDIIVATDADCRVPKTWIVSMVSCFKPDTGVVAGFSSVALETDNWLNRYQQLDFLALMAANAGSMGWGMAWSGSGQNLAYRRSAFQKINGFEAVTERISGDDMHLIQAIGADAAPEFNTNPAGTVQTAPLGTIKEFLNQRVRWASNSSRAARTNHFFFIFLLSTFSLNLSLLIAALTTGFSNIIAVLMLKMLADFAVIFKGLLLFNLRMKPTVFLMWFLLQPLYIPVIGLLGLAGKFRWKR